ncbi:putative signaling protein [Caenibius tardaugens NBRC 16725]|uniref:Putative signaling protein n=1 Tax=Caenibius tardaugens NBRC 16725 TaxID=1219035 RepID=U2YBV3_9SPHN|nr:PAS domain-containing protein [Caenibius tardaugens]GAD51016.1 putative signaling protein [Caenibius tardaugens NBRC 16725]
MSVHPARWENVRKPANDDVDADIAVYKTLLESTLAIPWRIDWQTKQFTYFGPQIEALSGWPRESWQSVEDWKSRIHPNEREYVYQTCVSQSLAGVDHEADFRLLTQEGGHVWVRDIVHVVRDEHGAVDSLIGFMIDISEQKRAEHELLELKGQLERLSYQDGLTGLSNRRFFDEQLDRVWNISAREHRSLGSS